MTNTIISAILSSITQATVYNRLQSLCASFEKATDLNEQQIYSSYIEMFQNNTSLAGIVNLYNTLTNNHVVAATIFKHILYEVISSITFTPLEIINEIRLFLCRENSSFETISNTLLTDLQHHVSNEDYSNAVRAFRSILPDKKFYDQTAAVFLLQIAMEKFSLQHYEGLSIAESSKIAEDELDDYNYSDYMAADPVAKLLLAKSSAEREKNNETKARFYLKYYNEILQFINMNISQKLFSVEQLSSMAQQFIKYEQFNDIEKRLLTEKINPEISTIFSSATNENVTQKNLEKIIRSAKRVKQLIINLDNKWLLLVQILTNIIAQTEEKLSPFLMRNLAAKIKDIDCIIEDEPIINIDEAYKESMDLISSVFNININNVNLSVEELEKRSLSQKEQVLDIVKSGKFNTTILLSMVSTCINHTPEISHEIRALMLQAIDRFPAKEPNLKAINELIELKDLFSSFSMQFSADLLEASIQQIENKNQINRFHPLPVRARIDSMIQPVCDYSLGLFGAVTTQVTIPICSSSDDSLPVPAMFQYRL